MAEIESRRSDIGTDDLGPSSVVEARFRSDSSPEGKKPADDLYSTVFSVASMYFAAIPPRKYPRGVVASAEALLSSSLSLATRFLAAVLVATALNPHGRRFPIAPSSRNRFLKWLVDLVEAKGSVYREEEEGEGNDENVDGVNDDPYSQLFEMYCDALKTPVVVGGKPDDAEYCFKTYLFPPFRVILRESTHFVCLGTTGLTSWTASFFMIEWMGRGISSSSVSSSSGSSTPTTSATNAASTCEATDFRSSTSQSPSTVAASSSPFSPSFSTIPSPSTPGASFLPLPSFLTDKNVLELGSGAGLTGIFACLRMKETRKRLRSFRFSDYHPAVLEVLRRNVECNLSSEIAREIASNGDVKVAELDWMDFSGDDVINDDDDGDGSRRRGADEDRRDERKLDEDWFPDVILGCDVVFDQKVVPYLANLLRHFLVRPKKLDRDESPPVAFIGSTVRNPETYRLFLDCLADRGLAVGVVATFDSRTDSSRRVRYLEAGDDEDPRVEIISVTSSTSAPR